VRFLEIPWIPFVVRVVTRSRNTFLVNQLALPTLYHRRRRCRRRRRLRHYNWALFCTTDLLTLDASVHEKRVSFPRKLFCERRWWRWLAWRPDVVILIELSAYDYVANTVGWHGEFRDVGTTNDDQAIRVNLSSVSSCLNITWSKRLIASTLLLLL